MVNEGLDRRLTEMAKANRALLRRARRSSCHCPAAVLNLGVSVGSLATQTACVVDLNRFLDQTVLDELSRARGRLAEDLELLDALSETGPDSSDVESLSRALLGRIRDLVEREDRVLYQPLLRLAVRGDPQRAPDTRPPPAGGA